MKRELTRIPLVGPMLLLAGMIPLEREGGAAALRQLLRATDRAVADGRQVVIFPEGTRLGVGEEGRAAARHRRTRRPYRARGAARRHRFRPLLVAARLRKAARHHPYRHRRTAAGRAATRPRCWRRSPPAGSKRPPPGLWTRLWTPAAAAGTATSAMPGPFACRRAAAEGRAGSRRGGPRRLAAKTRLRAARTATSSLRRRHTARRSSGRSGICRPTGRATNRLWTIVAQGRAITRILAIAQRLRQLRRCDL